MWKTTKIECDKTTPIIVSMTSWKDRINTVYQSLKTLQNQTLKPDKIILWLSSDEIDKNSLPEDLKNGDWYEIHWVDKNLMSFKKFLSIEQMPNAINITLDDDFLWNNKIIEQLYNNYLVSDKKTIIPFYHEICNTYGQPWGSIDIGGKTSIQWIASGCCLFPPNILPKEIFEWYDKIMLNKDLISDESYIMPFLIYHDIKIKSLTNTCGCGKLIKENSIIPITENSALHKKFFSNNIGNYRKNKKNQLLYDIVMSLPNEYQIKWKKTFVNFGNDIEIKNDTKETQITNKINICIIHYNTPYATECLIKSINKFTPNSNIYILDNSDSEPFTYKQNNLTVFDNTNGQIINFDNIIKKYPNNDIGKGNNWASCKHCMSVEKMFELINDNFILMDSDILLKKDISHFYQKDKIIVGEIELNKQRFAPYLCFINVNKCKDLNLHYFNENFMFGLGINNFINNNKCIYDTGTYFYQQIISNKYEVSQLTLSNFMEHYRSGSWNNKQINHTNTLKQWVDLNKNLWSDTVEEHIIVTLTSWTKRINNIPTVLTSILNQSLLPDKICLNLAIEEFPNKELSLPQDVQSFLKNNSNIIEVHWLKHNTKVWKKVIPTLLRYPNDCIICIDDDFVYPNDFIKTFIDKHKELPNNPLTGHDCKFKFNNMGNAHCGCASLTKGDYLIPMLNCITEEIINDGSDDVFYTYCYDEMKKHPKFVGKTFYVNTLKTISTSFGYSAENRIDIYKSYSDCIKTRNMPYNGNDIIKYICKTDDGNDDIFNLSCFSHNTQQKKKVNIIIPNLPQSIKDDIKKYGFIEVYKSGQINFEFI